LRIAIVADIHGNRTAFEAVEARVRELAPDLVLHGGDLADGGSSPIWVVDRIRELGWPGVVGNTDEMLSRPESFERFRAGLPQLSAMFQTVGEMADFARESLGEERLEWMRGLAGERRDAGIVLQHGNPGDCWRAPSPDATEAELRELYEPLRQRTVVYAHIHRAFVRPIAGLTVANTGSTGLPYDGDTRASFLLIDDGMAGIERVSYDIKREQALLAASGLPHWRWVAEMLERGAFQMPACPIPTSGT
jgi:predicted phosphodiesterase